MVDPDRGFFEMGMDSLMSIELRTRLQGRLGLELPSTLTFNHPTVEAVARFISARIERAAAASAPSAEPPSRPPAPAGRPAQSLSPVPESPSTPIDDSASEAELAEMLAERLAKLGLEPGGRP